MMPPSSSTTMWETLYAFTSRLEQEYRCAKNGIGPLRLTKWEIVGLMARKTWLDVQNAYWHDASLGARVGLGLFLYFLIMYIADSIWADRTSLTHHGFPLLQRPKGKQGRRWDYQAKLEAGARQFPNTPYIIRYAGFEQIVYPSSNFDEVKSIPVAQASLMEYFAHCFFEGWHFLGREIGALYGTLGMDLTRSLPARVRERQGVVEGAFQRVVGPFASSSSSSSSSSSLFPESEWKSMRLYATIQKLVAMINTPALLGSELGTDSRWINTFDLFVYSVMFAIIVLRPVPRLLRPVARYVAFLPNWILYWRLKRLARPTVKRDLDKHHQQTEGQQKHNVDVDDDGYDDKFRLAKNLAARSKPEDRTADGLAHNLIVAMFESMPTTICTLYFILSELALRPELADELRGELRDCMQDGDDDQLPESHLSELRKMDSFMRELAVFRRTTTPIQLSAGPEVPAGAIISVDAYNIAKSEERWENPETFNPYRFYKMRQEPGHENLHQFTSLDSDSPGWGGGPQACPGRFFAANTIKIFLAHLLLNYDIKFPPGAGKPVVGSFMNGSVMPDMMAQIMIREREKKNRRT